VINPEMPTQWGWLDNLKEVTGEGVISVNDKKLNSKIKMTKYL